VSQEASGTLSFVASPIGNLGDITLRALECLRSADIIACEDTRHSGRLLSRYEIKSRLVSLHEHNEASRSAALMGELKAGLNVAYLTDAGTPGISDPGGRLLQACLRESLPYEVLPGPCAVTTAATGSGMLGTAFYFGGFLPNKSGQRENRLREALGRLETCLFYESPHRIIKSLKVLQEFAPERALCVARELTKTHEEFRRGIAATLIEYYEKRPPKGEIVLVIAGTDLPKWIAHPS